MGAKARAETEIKMPDSMPKAQSDTNNVEEDLARQKEISSRIAEDAKTEKTPPSSIVVKRRARPTSDEGEPAIPSNQRHSIAENQIKADGYSRYAESSTDTDNGKRNTLHESGFKTADERMQQLSQDEQRRKASYNMLKSRLGEPSDTSYIPSRSLRDEPVYYGRDSKARLMQSSSSRTLNSEQDLKDEAMAIRLAADLASKKALEKNQTSSSLGGTSGANSVSITPLSTSSSSRQRIRDILQKQREESERQNKEKEDVERKVSSSFDPSKNKLLWVFR